MAKVKEEISYELTAGEKELINKAMEAIKKLKESSKSEAEQAELRGAILQQSYSDLTKSIKARGIWLTGFEYILQKTINKQEDPYAEFLISLIPYEQAATGLFSSINESFFKSLSLSLVTKEGNQKYILPFLKDKFMRDIFFAEIPKHFGEIGLDQAVRLGHVEMVRFVLEQAKPRGMLGFDAVKCILAYGHLEGAAIKYARSGEDRHKQIMELFAAAATEKGHKIMKLDDVVMGALKNASKNQNPEVYNNVFKALFPLMAAQVKKEYMIHMTPLDLEIISGLRGNTSADRSADSKEEASSVTNSALHALAADSRVAERPESQGNKRGVVGPHTAASVADSAPALVADSDVVSGRAEPQESKRREVVGSFTAALASGRGSAAGVEPA